MNFPETNKPDCAYNFTFRILRRHEFCDVLKTLFWSLYWAGISQVYTYCTYFYINCLFTFQTEGGYMIVLDLFEMEKEYLYHIEPVRYVCMSLAKMVIIETLSLSAFYFFMHSSIVLELFLFSNLWFLLADDTNKEWTNTCITTSVDLDLMPQFASW